MKSTSARVNLARQNLIRIKRWVNATATRAHRLRAFTPWLDDAIDMLHELAARKAQEGPAQDARTHAHAQRQPPLAARPRRNHPGGPLMMQTQIIATNPTYTPPPIQCRECHQIKPQNEFWDVPDRLCQMCWEAECDRGWWAAVKDLEPTGYPDEYRRVAREDHGEVEG